MTEIRVSFYIASIVLALSLAILLEDKTPPLYSNTNALCDQVEQDIKETKEAFYLSPFEHDQHLSQKAMLQNLREWRKYYQQNCM